MALLPDFIEELEEYNSLDNSEISELCCWLIAALDRPDEFISESLRQQILNELELQLIRYKKDFKVIFETVTPEPRDVKRLEYIGN